MPQYFKIIIKPIGDPNINSHGGVGIARAYRALGVEPPLNGEPAISRKLPDTTARGFVEQNGYEVTMEPVSTA